MTLFKLFCFTLLLSSASLGDIEEGCRNVNSLRTLCPAYQALLAKISSASLDATWSNARALTLRTLTSIQLLYLTKNPDFGDFSLGLRTLDKKELSTLLLNAMRQFANRSSWNATDAMELSHGFLIGYYRLPSHELIDTAYCRRIFQEFSAGVRVMQSTTAQNNLYVTNEEDLFSIANGLFKQALTFEKLDRNNPTSSQLVTQKLERWASVSLEIFFRSALIDFKPTLAIMKVLTLTNHSLRYLMAVITAAVCVLVLVTRGNHYQIVYLLAVAITEVADSTTMIIFIALEHKMKLNPALCGLLMSIFPTTYGTSLQWVYWICLHCALSMEKFRQILKIEAHNFETEDEVRFRQSRRALYVSVIFVLFFGAWVLYTMNFFEDKSYLGDAAGCHPRTSRLATILSEYVPIFQLVLISICVVLCILTNSLSIYLVKQYKAHDTSALKASKFMTQITVSSLIGALFLLPVFFALFVFLAERSDLRRALKMSDLQLQSWKALVSGVIYCIGLALGSTRNVIFLATSPLVRAALKRVVNKARGTSCDEESM